MCDKFNTSHVEILSIIDEYNNRIFNGDYYESMRGLDVGIYYELMAAHVVNTLLYDESLTVPSNILSILNNHQTDSMELVALNAVDNSDNQRLQHIDLDKAVLRGKLKEICFDRREKEFIHEACYQDVVYGKSLMKKIEGILGLIRAAILGTSKNNELILMYLRDKSNDANCIMDGFVSDYRKQAVLFRMREFKHSNCGSHIEEKNVVLNENGLNYIEDRNACQFAILHISVEATNSTGSGFKISEEYAVTCEHVIEGANEICANVIAGDGYPDVYDVGFGEVVYYNKQLDIALLKTEFCGNNYLEIEKRYILPEIGEEVVVLGYPLGYEMPQSNQFGPNISFYHGYVSSNQVSNGNSITFLDIDVKSGNSGSPVISLKTGKVIGIVKGIKLGGRRSLTEKMPFMIPIQYFVELLREEKS